jgi:two-component system response regulator MtrA
MIGSGNLPDSATICLSENLAKSASPVVILLIEGSRHAGASVQPILEKRGFRVVRVTSGKEAQSRAKSQRPVVVVFDVLAWRGNSTRLCASLRDAGLPVLVLLAERAAAQAECPEGTVALARPFTARKFINCVTRLLPEQDGDVLRLNDIQFNVQHRHVRRGAADYRLTPMQARLLEVFMRHPGETLSRHYLIKQVWKWNTDDLDDTRTLDVHVRWLREIIEDVPNAPVYLTTVRGVGYRLGLPEKPGGMIR